MPHLPLKEIHRLVIQAQEGQKEAFSRLYDATADAQYFTALSMLKQPSLAEDAVQTIYMKVYQNIGSLTLPDYFLSWLSRITYNTCVNILDSRWRRNSELDDEVLKELPDSHDDVSPLQNVILKENRRYLLSLLNELSLEHRTILVMRFYQELKVREIAEIMGLSEGTVKSRIHYGLKRLKKALRENGIRSPESLLGAGVFLRHCVKEPSPNSLFNELRSKASDCLKITGTCTAVGFLAVGAAANLPNTQLSEVMVREAGTYTNEPAVITVKAALRPGSDLKAFYENGEDLPVSHTSGSDFQITAVRNGKIKVILTDGGVERASKEVTVDQIDQDGPVLDKSELHKGIMRVYLSDELSGINYEKLRVYSGNTALPLTRIDKSGCFIEFSCREEKQLSLKAEDMAGNSKTFVLDTVEHVNEN